MLPVHYADRMHPQVKGRPVSGTPDAAQMTPTEFRRMVRKGEWTGPILLPVVDRFGSNRMHFAMICHLNLLIGIATPPMGIGLYILSGVAKIKFEEIVKALWPFLIPLIIVLLLITYFPQLTLFLPDLLMSN